MQTSLTFSSTVTLFGIMLVLAFIPGISVAIVMSRTAAGGFVHGLSATIGIITGDVIFILLALYGLAVMASLTGDHFIFIGYLGGAILVWLGIGLLRSSPQQQRGDGNVEASLPSSFLAGLLVTLADQKAMLFYLGFLPVFIDMSSVSLLDVGIILFATVMSIATAKLTYALMAARTSSPAKSTNSSNKINLLAGLVLISVGLYLLLST